MDGLHLKLQNMLEAVRCDVGAAECHGMLCGMLSGPNEFDPQLWMSHFSGDQDLSAFAEGDRPAILEQLVRESRLALEDNSFGFSLLLPDDEQPLSERSNAFAGWCRGFLSGFGLSGLLDHDALGSDAREFLRDLERFGAIDSGAESDEGDEQAFYELTEFTRMGVMIIREEARIPAPEPSSTVH